MKVNFWYLFWGHALFWGAIALYALMLYLKGSALRRQLEQLAAPSAGEDGGEER